jgi:hypothetical protein
LKATLLEIDMMQFSPLKLGAACLGIRCNLSTRSKFKAVYS